MPSAVAKRRSIKSEAIKLVRGLPASSTWDDIMYRIYVRQKIEAGLADFRSGRVHSHAAIRKEKPLRIELAPEEIALENAILAAAARDVAAAR